MPTDFEFAHFVASSAGLEVLIIVEQSWLAVESPQLVVGLITNVFNPIKT